LRPNLVVACVGDESLHPGWLSGGEARSFDLFLVYYGDRPGRYREHCEHYRHAKGTKWELLSDALSRPAEVEGYRAVWLPDDDLRADLPTLNRLFRIFHRFGLHLAQPALARDSYASHDITLQKPLWRLRYTTFVEIMAPLFSREALSLLRHSFGMNRSGWGLDYYWYDRLRAAGLDRVAVIDAATVTHTRRTDPRGGYYARMAIDPDLELEQLMERFGLEPHEEVTAVVLPARLPPLRLPHPWHLGKRLLESPRRLAARLKQRLRRVVDKTGTRELRS